MERGRFGAPENTRDEEVASTGTGSHATDDQPVVGTGDDERSSPQHDEFDGERE